MNRIYKVIWNRTLGRSVVGPEFMRSHGKEKSSAAARAGLAAAVAVSWFGGFFPVLADVTVADPGKHAGTVTHTGDTYDIVNQEVKGTHALNRFDKFDVGQKEVANLHLGNAERQINIVNQKMNVDGVVNALQNNKIGGDVYFFSDRGIAIGKTGVINVGRLTLGTNASYGQKLYNEGFGDYDKMTAAARAQAVAGNGDISMAGTIYAQGDVVLGTKKDLTVNGSIYAGLGTQGGDVPFTESADTIRRSLVNLQGVSTAVKAARLGNGDVALYTEDTLTLAGSAAEKAVVKTLGGNISLTSSSHDAKLQADPTDVPGDGYISIKNAYLDTSAADRGSGKVDIRAERDVMGTARVDVDDTTIDASGKNGHQAGNVSVAAAASTKLYSWDIGDGAYAQVKMGKNSSGRNTILGDSISVSAAATTTGDVSSTGGKTDAEIAAAEKQAAEANSVLDTIEEGIQSAKKAGEELVKDLRFIAQATKVAAGADVDVVKTDMKALGTADQAAGHGDLSLTADAASAVSPTATADVLGYGVNVGISDVTSHVNVDDSQLYAAGNLDVNAAGDNTVSMAYIELNLLDTYVRSTVNFSWAELSSDVSAKVGKEAVLTSGGNTDISAASTRTLSSSVSNGGDTNVLGLAASVAMADTKAEAQLAGTAYAGGDVSVAADNRVSQSESGIWQADTSKAASASGLSSLHETVDAATGIAGSAASKAGALGSKVKDNATLLFNKIKTAVSRKAAEEDMGIEMQEMAMIEPAPEPGGGEVPGPAAKKPWNQLGLNGATAILLSHNTSDASVTGTVRGLSDRKGADGTYAGDAAKGAKSLSVTAETLSRSAAKAGASQSDPPKASGAEPKAVTMSAALSYVGQKNSSQAYVSGDVKTTGDVAVKADTIIPWQTKLTGTTPAEILMNTIFTAIDGTGYEAPSYLVDSWTNTTGGGKTAAGAASIAVVNYDNSAAAFIGKEKADQVEAPQVVAGGQVDVAAKTDITTANFTGFIPNVYSKAPINLWKNLFGREAEAFLNTKGWSGDEAAKNGLGGAALAVRQDNASTAYIGDGAMVKGKDVNVSADTEAWNLAFSAAGGQASSLAVDASVGVSEVHNKTKASIGDAEVTAEQDAAVRAEDYTVNVNASGAGAVTQGPAAVGGTFGYNRIDRQTEASLGGQLAAGGTVRADAENDGEIISASVAGSARYDKGGGRNLSGSRGFHAPNDPEEPGDIELQDFVNGMAVENVNVNEEANGVVNRVAGRDHAMAGNADQAKDGAALAAAVAVNRVTDSAKAVAAQTGDRSPRITADSLSMASGNDSAIYATSGGLSGSLSLENTQAIAGSFMYNSVTNTNEARVDGAELLLSSAGGKALTLGARNAARILNIAGSGSGTVQGNAAAGQISLNWLDDTTFASVTGSTIRSSGGVSIAAEEESHLDSYTGAVAGAFGRSGHAVGAAIGVNLMEGSTTASLEDTELTGKTETDRSGDVSVTASDVASFSNIMASGAGAGGFTGSFTGSGSWLSRQTGACVNSAKTMRTGVLTVGAVHGGSATLGLGNLAAGKNAAGASIGVMVNESTVNASLMGDADRAHVISTTGLSVTADNVYNGDATDSSSDGTAKTVAVGFAGGQAQFAGSGSVTVNVISQKTDALLGKGLYETGNGAVGVTAHSKANLFGLAGGLSLTRGSGVGAAVDVQHYTGHTYAGLADGVLLSKASSVKVDAEAEENMTSVAATGAGGFGSFAGAGAAGAHSISTDTKAYVGNETDTDTTDGAELTDAGDVSVTAADSVKLGTGAGAAGAAGTAGVGLTAAVEVVNQNVDAHVGNHTKMSGKSLTVKADAVSDSTTAAAGLGAGGTVGVAGSASETFVNQKTLAYVGKAAAAVLSHGADVKAFSSFKQGSGAGGAGAAGTVGVGLANATVDLSAVTKAYVDDGARVDGASGVTIDASHDTDITYATVAGGVSGEVGVSGALGLNLLDTETKAYAGDNTRLSAQGGTGGISITASDTTRLHGGNGGAAIGVGAVGAGGAVAVNLIKKDTEAYAGKQAQLDAAGNITLAAANKENLYTFTLQESGGAYAGFAGAANGQTLDITTKAYTNTGVKLNDSQRKGGSVSLSALHEVEQMDSTAIGAAGGIGSFGAAVDVGLVKTQTNAYLGEWNDVYAGGSVSIKAKDNMHDIKTSPFAGAVGGFGMTGSVSVYKFGGRLSDEDKASLTAKDKNGQDTDVFTWMSGEINPTNTASAFSAYETDSLADVQTKLSTDYKVEEPAATSGSAGTLARVSRESYVQAKEGITVQADDVISTKATMGSVSGGLGAAGGTVSVVHTDRDVEASVEEGTPLETKGALKVAASADHTHDSDLVGASLGAAVTVQGTVNTWKDRADVHAYIGDTGLVEAGSLSVTSSNKRKLTSKLLGASASLAALNGAVTVARVTGTSYAGLGDPEGGHYLTKIQADGDVNVTATADTDLSADVTGPAAGVFAGTGTGADLASAVAAKTYLGQGDSVQGKNITFKAENTPKLSARADAYGLGLGAVGVTVAQAKSQDSVETAISDNAIMKAEKELSLTAAMLQPQTGYNVLARGIAGSGGVVTGSVAVVEAGMKNTAKTSVGKGASLAAGTLSLAASHGDRGNVSMDSVGAGAHSGLGGDIRYTVDSTASVSVGDGAQLSSQGEMFIQADNASEKAWADGSKADNAVSAGAALTTGNGVVSHTTLSHTTSVDLGKAALAAGTALTEQEADEGMTVHDKNAITIDAASRMQAEDRSALSSGSAVGAAHVRNTTEAKADTSVSVAEGAVLTAGDTETAKAAVHDTFAAGQSGGKGASLRGGSIGIGTKNDADLYGSTLVDVFGAGGYAGSTNDVTYTGQARTSFGGSAETAAGDVRIAAGRSSGGEEGTISTDAHSDILNATIIPISIVGDPLASTDSTADLTIGKSASIASDRDVYLQSNAGNTLAKAGGAVKDWFNALKGALGGPDGYGIGNKKEQTAATAQVDGKVQTGIHRVRNVKFWGEPEKDEQGRLTGRWKLYSDRDGTISYTVSGSVPVGTDLYTRYEQLKNIQGDDAAMAAYAAERLFLEQKMVEQGLGYYVKRGDKQEFVYTPEKGLSEYQAAGESIPGLAEERRKYMDQVGYLRSRTRDVEHLQSLYAAWQTASGVEKDKAAAAYRLSAAGYNLDHGTSLPTNPAAITQTDLAAEGKRVADRRGEYQTLADEASAASERLTKLREVTDYFLAHGGSEEKLNQMETDMSEGGYVEKGYLYTDGNYYRLLHTASYAQMTRNIVLHPVSATLGDIHLEGDTVYGAGTLSAPGDGSVTITNNTPYNLYVNDVTAAGAGGITGAGTGGRITLNGTALSAKDGSISKAIAAKNRDSTKSVSFTTVTRDATGDSSVNIQNVFRPTDAANRNAGDNQSLFAAPSLHLSGLIYNPRGAVTAQSAKGDIYTEGSINGGTVQVTADNGDYIQSYSDDPNYRVFSAGGSPLKNDGSLNTEIGSGILANGNIFISARYVNINSTIQSGRETWAYEIPKDFQLYYKKADGTNAPVSLAEAQASPKAHTYYVGKKAGTGLSTENNPGSHLTYDAEHDRFVLSGVEVAGGHVSLVGTIINTAKEGAAVGKIRALDGYGTISVVNQTEKTLELAGLNTGDGVEGTITLTDLQKDGTGAVAKTTVYRRNADGITRTVTYQTDLGMLSQITPGLGTTDGTTTSTTYQPDGPVYYSLQTGTDSSEERRYELHKKGVVDWWGIQDREPTKQDLLDEGGKEVSHKQGVETILNGGYYVSDDPVVGSKTSDNGHYITSEHNYATQEPEEVWDIQSSRKWYYLGLAKDWDVTLTETTYNTKVKQFSVKADYPIGIEFFGSQDGGNLSAEGKGSFLITGMLKNDHGSTRIVGMNPDPSAGKQDITQTKEGFISTKDLYLGKVGTVGTASQAIRTNAETLSGDALDDFYVSSSNALHVKDIDVSMGTLSLSADNGIIQEPDTLLKGNRIELDGGSGSIEARGGREVVRIQTGQGYGAGYGLKAKTEGDVWLYNVGGDLYVDSVSAGGSAILWTDGSFVDNNFTGEENVSATEKLAAWARAAVLEHENSTIAKQKKLLAAKVQEKYNEYQNLSSYVDDKGVYTLTEADKAALPGGTDVDAYVAAQQKRYDELKGTVGTWKQKDVAAYISDIENSKDTTLYGNADLTAEALTGDTYLTKEEKAEVLVGSAKSAKDLLLSFTPGSIKEGITDTRTTVKQTPHVTGGERVYLNTRDTAGRSIGTRTTKTIDLSDTNLKNLTAGDLAALAAAERGDFQVKGNQVTVTSVQPIEVSTAGRLGTYTDGDVYLNVQGSQPEEVRIRAGQQVRLKAAGGLGQVSVNTQRAGGDVILEAGDGAIQLENMQGGGVLTARAKEGVSIRNKEDLTIHTLYASDGNVSVNLGGAGSLYAEGSGSADEDYVNVEGKSISITGVKDVKGKDPAKTVGLKVSEDGGILTLDATGTADITVLSTREMTPVSVKAGTLTLSNRGNLSGGTVSAGQLAVENGGTITGTQFTATGPDGDKAALTYRDTPDAAIRKARLVAQEGSVSMDVQGVAEDIDVAANQSAELRGENSLDVNTVAAGGDISLEANGNLNVDRAAAKGTVSMEAGDSLVAGTVVAGNVEAGSGNNMQLAQVIAARNASLTSREGSIDVLASAIGRAFSLRAGQNIRVGSITVVAPAINAGGGITLGGRDFTSNPKEAVDRSLYGDRWLGHEARGEEERFLIHDYTTIGFAPAAEEEDYAAVMK